MSTSSLFSTVENILQFSGTRNLKTVAMGIGVELAQHSQDPGFNPQQHKTNT
jgi:hypothetical protein